ncbi:hypothetical protein GCM10008957_20480 [Deinococcus ruber]|uniref:Uncharacterized protein n=1 Tax=Deinococcus ruber TaxID=1848197 RepID=A0A918F7H9_9DEIO|nr:hypothetical protein GCM10008957_20480 [Deinococcus ruber]
MDEVTDTSLAGLQQYIFINKLLGVADERQRTTNEYHIEYQWAAAQVRQGAANAGRVKITHLPYYLILRQHFPTLAMQKLETLWNTLRPLLEMADRRETTLDKVLTLNEYLGTALRVQAMLHVPTSSSPHTLLEALMSAKSMVVPPFEQEMQTKCCEDLPIGTQTDTLSVTPAPVADFPIESEPLAVCRTDDLTMLPELEVFPRVTPLTDEPSPVPVAPLDSTSSTSSEKAMIREIEPVAAAEAFLSSNFSESPDGVVPAEPPALAQIVTALLDRFRNLEIEADRSLNKMYDPRKGHQCVLQLRELHAAAFQLQTAADFAKLSVQSLAIYDKVVARTEEWLDALRPFWVAL